MDFYGDFASLKAAFRKFIESIPFYGFAVLCIDHPEVQSLIPHLQDRKIITYGLSPTAVVRGLNVVLDGHGVRFDAAMSDRVVGGERTIKDIHLPMFGQHNVLNALAAVSVAAEMGIADDVIREGLGRFKGVKRRFTKVGEVDGITVIDDYGHHPVEIAAVLKAARTATKGRVIAVVQPHRYSRLQQLFEGFCTCFNDADHDQRFACVRPPASHSAAGPETLSGGHRRHRQARRLRRVHGGRQHYRLGERPSG